MRDPLRNQRGTVLVTGATSGIGPAQQQARQTAERRQAAVEAMEQDPVVNALRETFNARLHPDTIQPKD